MCHCNEVHNTMCHVCLNMFHNTLDIIRKSILLKSVRMFVGEVAWLFSQGQGRGVEGQSLAKCSAKFRNLGSSSYYKISLYSCTQDWCGGCDDTLSSMAAFIPHAVTDGV